MIISSGNNSEIEAKKLEIVEDDLSETDMEVEIDKAIIFSIIDLMTNPVSKLFAITYNSEAKMLLITCWHFVDD